jgi:hypothetical protein
MLDPLSLRAQMPVANAIYTPNMQNTFLIARAGSNQVMQIFRHLVHDS